MQPTSCFPVLRGLTCLVLALEGDEVPKDPRMGSGDHSWLFDPQPSVVTLSPERQNGMLDSRESRSPHPPARTS